MSPLNALPADPGPREDGPVSLGRIPGIIRRGWPRIVALTAIIGVPLAVLGALVPPHYASIASVRVDTRQSATETQEADLHISTDAVAIRTQVDILKAPALAGTVARILDLKDVPEFGGSRKHSAIGAAIHAAIFKAEDFFGLAPPPLTEAQREVLVANKLAAAMEFVNDDRSYVIGIQAKAKDPVLASRIANTYAQVFLDYTRQQKIDAVKRSNAWFDERLEGMRTDLRNANMKVQMLRAQTGLIDDPAATGGGGPVTVAAQQMAQLNSELMTAGADLAEKQADYREIEAALAGRTGLDATPAVVRSPLIAQLLSQEAEIDNQVANMSATRASNYPELQALRSAQRTMHERVVGEVQHIGQSVRAEADAARARETTIRGLLDQVKRQVGDEGQQEIRVAELQSEADAAKSIYMNYLNLYQTTANQVGLQQPDASLVSSGMAPLKPAMPTPPILAVAGLLLGFLIATFLTVRRQLVAGSFRTAEEVEQRTAVPTLVTIPLLDPREPLHPGSYDAIADLRSLLIGNRSGKAGKVVMVTSALPGEGKTFLAASLARSATTAGRSTLVIDCDIGNPGVAAAIDGEIQTRDDLIRNGCMLKAASPVTGEVVPQIVTVATGGHDPGDFLSTPELEAAIRQARDHYDLVILDVPPVLMSVEARVLGTLADSVVLVVRWMDTPSRMVAKAIETLAMNGIRVSGIALNRVVLRKLAPSESSLAYVRRRFPKHFAA